MSYIKRFIEDDVLEDLKDKMVLISGPRQAGKTTLARHYRPKGHSHAAVTFLDEMGV
jgi:predicted AAA+ superfamily ATPase